MTMRGFLVAAIAVTLVAQVAKGHGADNAEEGAFACISDSPALEEAFRSSVAAADEAAAANGYVAERDFQALSTGTRQPLRIYLDTSQLTNASIHCNVSGETKSTLLGTETKVCTDADVLTAAKAAILTDYVLPAAAEALSYALHVDRLVNVTVQAGCGTVPVNLAGTTYPDADFGLVVTAAPTATGTLAWATACELDTATRRPTLGHANFGPSSITWEEEGSYNNANVVATAVHELLHALGFTKSFFNNYFADAPYATTVVEMRGKNVTLLNTTTVASVAQAYYNCSAVQGAELEDEGQSGSAGSHWDRRVLPNEMMAPAGGIYLSNFTLAAMHDSGFYTANFSAAAMPAIAFGQNAGCGFLNSSCNTTEGGMDDHFCWTSGEEGCTPLAREVGTCGIVTRTTALDPLYQYFDSPTRGGLEFFDGCPVFVPQSSKRCAFNRTLTVSDRLVGNYLGAGGRCFRTDNTGSSSGLVQSGISSTGSGFRCLEARCTNSGAQLEVRPTGATAWTACPADGTAGNVSAPSGFTGTIRCPVASEVCADTTLWHSEEDATTPVTSNTSSSTAAGLTTTLSGATATSIASSTPGVAGTTPPDTVTATFGGAVTATPVPTVVALSFQLQFKSRLALGQLSSERMSTISAAISALLGVPTSRLTVAAFLGTGAVSVVRFTAVYPAGSAVTEEELVAIVGAAAANSTSSLATVALPIATTVAAVVDCTNVCSSTGTSAVFRNADNTDCVCTCRNQFTGTTCGVCASPYSGSACDTCADGFAGYPTCFADVNCTQPSAHRVSITQSGECTAAMGSNANEATRACLADSCSCLGGQYSAVSLGCSNPTASSSCQRFLCSGQADRCLLRARLSAMRDAGDACANDTATMLDALAPLEAWCHFDGCTDQTLANCTLTEFDAACGRVAVGDFSLAVGLSLSQTVAMVIAGLIALLAL